MRRLSLLRAERLEPRENPSALNAPWPAGGHLTLSFALDGTAINGQPSNLSTLLTSLGPNAKAEVLQAFQTWAAEADINIGLVGDDGSAFGTGGPVQGDPRFGDIRIGGVPLSPDVLGVTTPYSLFNNYSGDVVINTAAPFGAGGYDPYTVLLHEAGHALGLGDSADPSSIMYGHYEGPRTGLSAGDIAAIQSLYGPRVPDQYEGTAGNDSVATATPYSSPVAAELSTPQDVDVYRFTGVLLAQSATVSLQAAGLSFITAKVEILDAAGRVLASAAVADPTHNNVSLSLNHVQAGATYYVRVTSAEGDVFGVGTYQLSVQQRSPLSGVTGLVGGLLDTVGDTLGSAVSLLGTSLLGGTQTEYSASGSFYSPSDVDFYQITVPQSYGTGPVNLITTVWGQSGAVLNPWIDVEDATGHKLNVQVLTSDGNTTTVQVSGLAPGQAYFLKVTSDSRATGGYQLSAVLRPDPVAVPAVGGASLDADHPTATGTFNLAQSGQVHYVLSADGATGSGQAAELTVRAADGTVVAHLLALAGRGRSLDVFLPAGQYTIEVRPTDPSVPLTFQLSAVVVTDPIGAYPVDPTTTPDGSTSSDPSPTAYDPPPMTGSDTQQFTFTPGVGGAMWY